MQPPLSLSSSPCRGAWADGPGTDDQDHWKLAPNENFLRMRMKMVPNPAFDSHADASAARDNSARHVVVNKLA